VTLSTGEHEATLNGVRIHFTIRGSGPSLIAISGGPGMDARLWDDFGGIDDFVTVIAIHPRGSGLSGDSPDGAYSLSDYASDVDALRRHIGLHLPIIAGWSHCGIVAQQVAISYPDDLSRLILIETSAFFGEFLDDVEGAVAAFRDEPWYATSLDALKREWAGEYETDEDMAALWADEVKFYFAHFNERVAPTTNGPRTCPSGSRLSKSSTRMRPRHWTAPFAGHGQGPNSDYRRTA
jgi:proline iminopeptidase